MLPNHLFTEWLGVFLCLHGGGFAIMLTHRYVQSKKDLFISMSHFYPTIMNTGVDVCV